MAEWGIIDDRIDALTPIEAKAVLSFLLKNTRITYTGEAMSDIEALGWVDKAFLGILDGNNSRVALSYDQNII